MKYLKRKPVSIELWDRELFCVEQLGGGMRHGEPKNIAILLHLDANWLVYRWKHSEEIAIVPARDVICIAADLEEKE